LKLRDSSVSQDLLTGRWDNITKAGPPAANVAPEGDAGERQLSGSTIASRRRVLYPTAPPTSDRKVSLTAIASLNPSGIPEDRLAGNSLERIFRFASITSRLTTII
jgi:hypothetical protein